MGLVKETLEAIIRIDENLDELCRLLGASGNHEERLAKYGIKLQKQTLSTYQRVLTEKEFCYPDHLTFGGRIKAVRMFNDLTQTELGNSIGITFGHVSNLEKDVSNPSAMLIRAVSRRFNIDETWLATGQLPQTAEPPVQYLYTGTMVPLSGRGED